MRKRAFCNNCRKMRKIEIVIISFKRFDLETGEVIYTDTNIDGEDIRCAECWSIDLKLSDSEKNVIYEAAYAAR